MSKRIFKLMICFQFLFTTVLAQQEKVLTFDDTSVQKEALYSKDKSIKSFWLQVRSLYGSKEQNFMDSWILQNEDKTFPETKIIMLAPQKNVLRIIVSDETLINNIEFNAKSENFVKLNGEGLANIKSKDLEKVLKHLTAASGAATLSKLDLSKNKLSLSAEDFKKLNSQKKVIYFLHKRKLFEMAYEIIQDENMAKEVNKKFSFLSLFIQSCQAAIESQCLTAGGLPSITDKGRCGDQHIQIPKEYSNISRCSPEQTLCHPLFYGLSANGNTFCADRGVSCSQLSPLNSSKDLQRIMQSLKKVNLEQSQIFQKMDDYINEATKICQQSEVSKKCDALLARRSQFNSLIVDFEQGKNNPPARMSKSSSWPPNKNQFEEARLDQTKDDSCNWWCRNKSWATPVSIVAATLATTVSICKFTHYSFFGICSKNKDKSSSSSTSSDSSSVISSPVAPTAADYTSVQ